jgi:hypothetical protein
VPPDGPTLGQTLSGTTTALVVRGPSVSQADVAGPLEALQVGWDVDLGALDPASLPVDPACVLLAVRDRLELRQVVASCAPLPASALLVCLVLEGDRPVLTAGRPRWPAVLSLVAGSTPVCFTALRLAAPLAAGGFVADLARRCTPQHLSAREVDDPPGVATPVRPDEAVRPSGAEWRLDGLDGQLLNPIGFVRRPQHPRQPLLPDAATPSLYQVDTPDGPVTIDGGRGATEQVVARLRQLAGVHLTWPAGTQSPSDYCRIVVGLAMSGVPVSCDPAPPWAREWIAEDLLRAVEAAGSTEDALDREVTSIRQRRAAHAHHAQRPWRGPPANGAGRRDPALPRVSVLLPTRRPEQLGFALRQVARQRGVDLELVLAAHGHEPDRSALAELPAADRVPVTWLSAPAELPFGAVLNEAAARARGDVLLKMDDDDWYGPDFVRDLLLAYGYSGADVVGTPPEFIYVEPLDVTTRRKDGTERYHSIVAGGTILVSRDAFSAVGGFRPLPSSVDAALLAAVNAAGGSVYRTHGHDYVLRRGAGGHTWDPGLGYFVSRSRTMQQWRGFRPSPLLEVDDRDRPTPLRLRRGPEHVR